MMKIACHYNPYKVKAGTNMACYLNFSREMYILRV